MKRTINAAPLRSVRLACAVALIGILTVFAAVIGVRVDAASADQTALTIGSESDYVSVSRGVYMIQNSSKCLDVLGGSTASGARTQLYASNTTPAQRWRIEPLNDGYYRIVEVESGKVLDVSGAVAKNGTTVWQWDWNGSNAQKWRFKKHRMGGYTIVSALSSKLVLDVQGASTANGARVQIYTENGSRAQAWNLVAINSTVSNGDYTLANAGSGKMLDVSGASAADMANIWQYTRNGTKAQTFKLTYNANTGYYTMICAASGKAVDVAGASSASGANVWQYRSNGTRAQLWTITKQSDGTLSICSATGGMALAVRGGSSADCANVEMAPANGANAQKWRIASVTTASSASAASGSTTYDVLSITIEQMAQWNWNGNPYAETYLHSMAELRKTLNPANSTKLEFADLRKPTQTSASQLNSFINTYGSDGKLAGLGAVFVDAAKKYGLNQDYLLAHAICESGWGKSTLASGYYYSGGTIDGKYYPAGTYYNFFGIGAYDTSPLSGGRKLAIINGWNSPAKAVDGAAKWIADNYIYRSGTPQYTLYAMKWDYLYSNAYKSYGWHQYATGGTWTQVIAQLMQNIYDRTGTGGSLSYVIPRYKS